MTQPSPSTSNRTSVLLQILVVVFLLGFLASMCPFTLTAAREKARRANCLSNLKQIGLTIRMYAEIFGGRCPMDSNQPTLVGCLQLLSNACDSAKILVCPSDDRLGAKPEKDFAKITSDNISYSYVPNCIWQGKYPDSILALDRIYETKADSHWPTNSNHNAKGGNILFNDGHVEFLNALPSALKDKDGKEVALSP